jgi:NADPH:quinone reductase-like Zn-dependent oxidoreductase
MKAQIINENGGIDKFQLVEIEVPEIKEDEVLIRNKAISINRVDCFVRQHRFALDAFMKPSVNQDSHILGWDVSGVVEYVGDEVKEFKVGDEVFGAINFYGQGKTYAEYVAAPASQLVLKPKSISHEKSVGASFAGLTAWQSLVTYAKIKKGDKVIIHSAAGGVGHYAIQLAKHFGAYVFGTGSSTSEGFIISQGADEFIDYTYEKFEEIVTDADIIIDSQVGDHILRSLTAVKKGGSIITLLNMLEDEAINQKIRA